MAKGAKKEVAKMSATRKPPAEMIAEVTGLSKHTVYSIQVGKRPKSTNIGKVEQAETLLTAGMGKLVDEVKRVVNF